MYELKPDLALAREFWETPIGIHSPNLQRLLRVMRAEPIPGKYALLTLQGGRRMQLVRCTGRRNQPLDPVPGVVFEDPREAERYVFALRWEAWAGSPLPWPSPTPIDDAPPDIEAITPRLLGYTQKLSFRPGETVDLKLSSRSGERAAHVSILRMLSASSDPTGCGLIERPLDPPIDHKVVVQPQRVPTGSWAHAALGGSAPESHITAAVLVSTTLPAHGRDQAVLGITPAPAGFWLGLDADGHPVLEVQGETTLRLRSPAPVQTGRWMRFVVTIAPDEATLRVEDADPYTVAPLPARSVSGRTPPAATMTALEATIAARRPAPDAPPTALFNGKIDRPRLVAGQVAPEAIGALMNPIPRLPNGLRWIAAWDFSIGMDGREIRDVAPGERHGTVVNMPMRAVTGANWTGDVHDWHAAPDQYGAISFAEDDLYDCQWETTLSVTLPHTLASGVYAALLDDGGTPTRVVFFVRPAKDAPPAACTFIASTANFLAYANFRQLGRKVISESQRGRLWSMGPEDLLMELSPELGASCYDKHPDGSGIALSSRLRPILNLQADTRLSSFAGDMFVVAWLDSLGIPVDIVTDEDLHAEGAVALAGTRVVLTGGHPEYYSAPMLDALQAHLRQGGRMLYLGGNGFYWRIAVSPHWPGAIELRRPEGGTRAWESRPGEGYLQLDGNYGGLWRRVGRSPNRLVGIGFAAQGFDCAVPYFRTEQSQDPRAAFVFRGVSGEVFGQDGVGYGGAAGQEIDRFDVSLGSPPHGLVLASSRGHTDHMLLASEEVGSTHLIVGGTENPNVRADMVFFETENGGAVFAPGSISWPSAMGFNSFDNDCARITGNVLRAFLSDHRFAPDNPYEG